MTLWDWVRSVVIFAAAIFIFNNFFISLSIPESIILTLFLGVCVFHIIDIREDFMKKLHTVRIHRARKAADDGTPDGG